MQFEAFLGLIALMAVLAAILVWVRLQRKGAEAAITDAPETAPVLAAGVRASMGEEATSKKASQTDEGANDTSGGATSQMDQSDITNVAQSTSDLAEPSSKEIPGPTPTAPPNRAPKSDQLSPSTEPAATSLAAAARASAPDPAPPPPTPPKVNPAPIASQENALRDMPAPASRTKQARPLDVELSLDIKAASRSMMRLSLDFTLEVTNRTDKALRDVNVAGELASVRQGAAGPAPVDKTRPLTTIDRIAPRQCRQVSGTLQLPIAEVTAIQQNGKPVVIPLVHFRLGTTDQPAIKRTFVVGTPSTTSTTRVHPLLFDGPPGGLPPLRAQLIKQR